MDLRPKKLDIYITKKFLSTFFIALLLIIGIVIIHFNFTLPLKKLQNAAKSYDSAK